MLQSNMHARLFAFANTRRHLMLSKKKQQIKFLSFGKKCDWSKNHSSGTVEPDCWLDRFYKNGLEKCPRVELRTQSASPIIDISIVVVVERKRALNRLAFTLAQLSSLQNKTQCWQLGSVYSVPALWKILRLKGRNKNCNGSSP